MVRRGLLSPFFAEILAVRGLLRKTSAYFYAGGSEDYAEKSFSRCMRCILDKVILDSRFSRIVCKHVANCHSNGANFIFLLYSIDCQIYLLEFNYR